MVWKWGETLQMGTRAVPSAGSEEFLTLFTPISDAAEAGLYFLLFSQHLSVTRRKVCQVFLFSPLWRTKPGMQGMISVTKDAAL